MADGVVVMMLSWMLCYYFFFFFSSRRRHTRFDCDWSSDVCSSDLKWRIARGEPTIVLVERGDQDASESSRAGFSRGRTDRKSTRLNSSHSQISYAVFCLKNNRVADAQLDLRRHDRVLEPYAISIAT